MLPKIYLHILFIFLLVFTQLSFGSQYPLVGKVEIRAALIVKEKKLINESLQYWLQTNDGKFYFLKFQDKIPVNLHTGDRLRILKAIEVAKSKNHDELIVFSKDVTVIKRVRGIPSALGIQKTLVMLINFKNEPNVRPWTLQEIRDIAFNKVKDQFMESSYDQTLVLGDVVGWYVLDLNNTDDCDYVANALTTLADNEAQKAGINVKSYSRKVYMFPSMHCPWAGLATIQEIPSKAWVNGDKNPFVLGHELGHNLGLYHAKLLSCTKGPDVGDCENSLDDRADTMGGRSYLFTHFNAFQKERLGWLNFLTSPPIQTVTTSGTYIISPYEKKMGVKALKILKEIKADGSRDYYYFEFRRAMGFDKLLDCEGCDYLKGVLVHRGNDTSPDSSDLLNMSWQQKNSKQVALLPGMSFSTKLPKGNVTVTLNSIDNNAAVLTFNFN